MAGDINIVAIVKGDERYVFMFDDDSRAEALRTLGRYASNPELSFSWYDAAVLSQKIRKSAVAAEPATIFRRQTLHDSGNASASHELFPGIDLWSADDPFVGDEPDV